MELGKSLQLKKTSEYKRTKSKLNYVFRLTFTQCGVAPNAVFLNGNRSRRNDIIRIIIIQIQRLQNEKQVSYSSITAEELFVIPTAARLFKTCYILKKRRTN